MSRLGLEVVEGDGGAPPDPLAVPREHTSKGKKREEEEGRKAGKGEGRTRAPVEMMPPNQNPKYATVCETLIQAV